MSDTPVIRIVKKKHGHAGSHGGSWKVAYADFVTAMMAFFLVMWIISMNDSARDEIQNYFNNPAAAIQSRAGIAKLAAGGMSPISTGTLGMSAKNWHELALEAQRDRLGKVQEKLEREIARRPDLSRLGKHVEIGVNSAGLEIELLEATDSLFFRSGSADLPAATVKLLEVVAHELGRLPNPVAIEGHTDSVPINRSTGGRGRAGYSNWELSADRANAARRVMETHGLRSRQVVGVYGYADSKLRDPDHPTRSINRRVTIMVSLVDPQSSARETGRGSGDHADLKSQIALQIKPLE